MFPWIHAGICEDVEDIGGLGSGFDVATVEPFLPRWVNPLCRLTN
ncbi:hypothetical protein [Oculatella sp. LEGE 06141]|nr:hypothetical protein [Oculatella sp. LEGE 06141]